MSRRMPQKGDTYLIKMSDTNSRRMNNTQWDILFSLPDHPIQCDTLQNERLPLRMGRSDPWGIAKNLKPSIYDSMGHRVALKLR